MKLSPLMLLVAGTTVLRLGFAWASGLGVDESYMVAAGRVLSLGYFDHPPAAWWLSHGAAWLFGSEAPFFVRLPFVLLFAVSQVLMGRIGGFWAVVLLNLSPVFGVTSGTWVLPDGPLDCALLGAVACLMAALSGRGLGCRAGAGACAGLALLSKYSAVLSVGGVFLFLLTERRWLLRPGPYVALAVALLVFGPVLAWNAAHGWASFAFQGERALGLRFNPLGPLTVLGGGALFVLPWIWVPMMLVWPRAFRGGERERLLAWAALPPVLVFALVSVWSSQRVLFHWAAPGYLMLFPLLGRAVGERIGSVHVRRAVAGTAAFVVACVAVIAVQVRFDALGGVLAGVVRKDPTAEGVDWVSLREALALPPGTLVGAFNWRDAGKLGIGLGPDAVMLCLSGDARQFGFAAPLAEHAGRDVVLLAVGPALPAGAERWFASVEARPPVSVRLRGRVLSTVTVALGRGLRERGP